MASSLHSCGLHRLRHRLGQLGPVAPSTHAPGVLASPPHRIARCEMRPPRSRSAPRPTSSARTCNANRRTMTILGLPSNASKTQLIQPSPGPSQTPAPQLRRTSFRMWAAKSERAEIDLRSVFMPYYSADSNNAGG